MYGYSSSPPIHHMNNPFANNDAVSANARYPAISTSPGLDQSAQYYGNASYAQQQQPQFGYAHQQPQAQYMNQQPQYAPSSPSGFQPTSSFGQQMAATISGSSYGYLSGQPTGLPQQQQQLGPAQQQISNNPGYVAQFDPYGPLAQWDGTSGQQQQQQYQQPQYQQTQQQQYGGGSTMYGGGPMSPTGVQTTMGTGPNGDVHPQDFVRIHKAEIEGWNSAGWKQFFTTFDGLANVWNARKIACGQQVDQLKAQLPFAGYYQQQMQSEIARVQALQKEAESNYDSVTASKFQMQEVFTGYRQSPDAASKRRVREATNAALQSLPGWPPSQI